MKISPGGEVWVENPDGTWTNHGAASGHTSSGSEHGKEELDAIEIGIGKDNVNVVGKSATRLRTHKELEIDREAMTTREDACFRLRLLIRHDSIDPDEITRALGMKPSRCWKAGEHVVTPRGKVLPSIHNHTSWSNWHDFADRKLLSSEFHALVDKLAPASMGLSRLASNGCDMVVLLDISGEFNVGSVFSSSDLQRLLELNIGLGFEVFPEGI